MENEADAIVAAIRNLEQAVTDQNRHWKEKSTIEEVTEMRRRLEELKKVGVIPTCK
jgi:hypothetical protein